MIPKTICQSAYSTDGPAAISEICRLVTRSGLSNSTLNFLRLCNIMEPMTELFTFHKVNYFVSWTFVYFLFRHFEWIQENAWKIVFIKNGIKLWIHPRVSEMCAVVKRIEGNGNQVIHRVKDAKTPGEIFSSFTKIIYFQVIFWLLENLRSWVVWPMMMSDQ